MRKLLHADTVLFLIFLLLCIPSLFGLLHPGYFVSDDGNWMVIRFSAFYEAFRHGQFPVRFLPRLLNGYGYPVSDFLYPLFLYLGIPLHLLKLNFVTTIKVIFGFSMVFSGILSFLWLKKIFTSSAALMGALAFVYFPYHLFDLYKRGSIGEVLALCIVPFILWQIERKNILLTAVGIGLLIPAHNTLAVLFIPIILLYQWLRQKNISHVSLSLLLGLGVSTFFWLPALVDKHYTVFDTTAVSNFSQYFLSVTNWYIAGAVSILALGLGVIGIVRKSFLAIFFEIILLLSLFLALPLSHIVWNILPLGKYVQFPFRFLSLTIICSSFLIAYGYSLVGKKYRLICGIILGIILIVCAVPVLSPKIYQYYPDSWYSTNQDSTTVQNEYLPVWVSEIPTNKTHVVQLIKGQGAISEELQNSSKISFHTSVTKDAIVQINTIYFPGWVVKVDGKTTSIVYANTFGLMQISVSKGMHTVTAGFGETPLRFLADILSLITLLGIGIISLIKYKKL